MKLDIKIGSRAFAPSGEYLAIVDKIEREEKYKRTSLLFYFRIVEGEFEGTVLRAWVPANYETFSPYTKLYQWFAAMLGYEPELAETLNVDDFFHRVLLVEVVNKDSKKTSNRFGNVSRIIRTVREL